MAKRKGKGKKQKGAKNRPVKTGTRRKTNG